MGGHAAGDVAAQFAVAKLPAVFDKLAGKGDGPGDVLVKTLTALNDDVRAHAGTDPGYNGMGTTMVMAMLDDDATGGWVAHVGDSRAYLYSEGTLRPLTEDHTAAAELVRSGAMDRETAETHPLAHRLTQALGVGPVRPSCSRITLQPGDRVLLCSDGLTGMLDDESIGTVLERFKDPEQACKALVWAANEVGGRDNITVVVVAVAPNAAEVTADA
jgi:protein phosphatase